MYWPPSRLSQTASQTLECSPLQTYTDGGLMVPSKAIVKPSVVTAFLIHNGWLDRGYYRCVMRLLIVRPHTSIQHNITSCSLRLKQQHILCHWIRMGEHHRQKMCAFVLHAANLWGGRALVRGGVVVTSPVSGGVVDPRAKWLSRNITWSEGDLKWDRLLSVNHNESGGAKSVLAYADRCLLSGVSFWFLEYHVLSTCLAGIKAGK